MDSKENGRKPQKIVAFLPSVKLVTCNGFRGFLGKTEKGTIKWHRSISITSSQPDDYDDDENDYYGESSLLSS